MFQAVPETNAFHFSSSALPKKAYLPTDRPGDSITLK
jgi:hypothetical protein